MRINALKAMVVSACAALALASCVGCSTPASTPSETEAAVVRVGTMPTEDILPLWVAQDSNMAAADGTTVEVVPFDSAQALSAAITAGEVDMAMTDIMRAAKLTESGTAVDLEWVTLGEMASQGVFGILAPADAPYSTLQEMAAYAADSANADLHGVGVGANTVPEYVFNMLCAEADVTIPSEEVASLPERYGLVASGQLMGAALPAPLLALGEANGMKVIADDSQGSNISQSVMVARAEWAAENEQAVLDVAEIWDGAVKLLTDDPEAYHDILVTNANLNETIAESYPISSYPNALSNGALVHPSDTMVQPVLDWMRSRGYGGAVSYDAATGAMSL